MGMDLETIVYYGFPLSEEYVEQMVDEHGDVDEYFHGLVENWRKHDFTIRVIDSIPSNNRAAYYAGLDNWTKTRCVEIDFSGEADAESWFVHMPSLQEGSDGGEPIDLLELSLAYKRDADVAIKDFCEQAGIAYRQPSWHVASRYL